MGMFGEIHAGMNAEQLEKILLEAIKENDTIKAFAKKHLYQWYLSECSEAFRESNHEIKDEFED
ncbi:MAG: hypothetical protein WC333_01790 [Dehalococcoidia bacterium]|jgi:hypothetical protein